MPLVGHMGRNSRCRIDLEAPPPNFFSRARRRHRPSEAAAPNNGTCLWVATSPLIHPKRRGGPHFLGKVTFVTLVYTVGGRGIQWTALYTYYYLYVQYIFVEVIYMYERGRKNRLVGKIDNGGFIKGSQGQEGEENP